MDIVDEIKSRLGIEDVVSQYVQLKKAGRNLKGLCPFHSEKTPSFVVSPDKQICHCFGCNKGGDIFAFIEEVEGVTFAEALEVLADRAGVKMDASKHKKKESKSVKDEYFKAHDLACEFFEKQLHHTNDGQKVLEYLFKRGLTDDTIREFRIGFAPDKYDELHPYLLKKGISKNILLKSGLIAAKNLAAENVYDKYRSRLIFPIFDYLGRVCGFGGRALKKDQAPKYLNSPENMIYSKSKVLYGLSHAKKYVKEQDRLVLVEGYFDVVLPYQAGVKTIAASSGTAVTSEQVRLVKRMTRNVVSCFDNDSAGFEASKRAFFLFQAEGIDLKVVFGLDEKDPADFVHEGKGDFAALIEKARDFVSVFIEKLLVDNDAGTLVGRKKVLSEILPCLDAMPVSSRDFFVRELAAKLKIAENHLYAELENFKLPTDHPARVAGGESSETIAAKFSAEDMVMALLLEYPFLFAALADVLKIEDFGEGVKSVYKALTDQYNSARDNFEAWNFDKGFLADNKEKIDVLRLYAEERYQGFSEESLEIELEKLVDKTVKDRKALKLKEIQNKIKSAEEAGKNEEISLLLREQQALLGG